MKFNEYWNNHFTKSFENEITYDNWLEKYQEILKNCKTPVLDLGCGSGNNTLFLTEKGLKVIACDYSKVALEKINKNFKDIETVFLDIAQTLPFKDNSFDVIVADLTLHYFDTPTTFSVMEELKRILTPNGYLFARVNSVADTNYGAGQGERIEENYYYVNGYNKRFFTLEDAEKFFSVIGKPSITEADMLRYSKPKKVIEISVKKEL